jgi:hypothetical protein
MQPGGFPGGAVFARGVPLYVIRFTFVPTFKTKNESASLWCESRHSSFEKEVFVLFAHFVSFVFFFSIRAVRVIRGFPLIVSFVVSRSVSLSHFFGGLG